jgi:tyrosine-protein phosphatase YwqE
MLNKLFGLSKADSKKQEGYFSKDWSFIGVDMHSHIIPGIDDGPKTIEESVVLVEQMMTLGYKAIVTTPHVRSDHYPNTIQTINSSLKNLQNELTKKGIRFPIRAAAEYFIDSSFVELLEKEPLLTINDKHVLIEFSFVFEPSKLLDIIFKIQTAGYTPILAHAERYTFYQKNIDRLKQLKERGCLLQLNLISLSGYYSSQVKFVAETLMKNNLYDYCGSDVHHIKHIDAMKKLLKSESMQQLRDYPFLNQNITV